MIDVYCRAKRVDNDDWVHGYYVPVVTDKNSRKYLIISGYAEEDCGDIYPNWFEVDPETVCHYTGLCDADGDFIYENDLVEFGTRVLKVWWNGESFQWQAKARECPYHTISGQFDFKYEKDYDNIDLGWIAAEAVIMGRISTRVVGNVFDDPELWHGDEPKHEDANFEF